LPMTVTRFFEIFGFDSGRVEAADGE
jgi:hypothetical protein